MAPSFFLGGYHAPLSDGDKTILKKQKPHLSLLRNGVSIIQSMASSIQGAQTLMFY